MTMGITESWFQKLARKSLVTRALLVSAVLLVLFLAGAPIVSIVGGKMSLAACSVAFISCWSIGMVSLATAELYHGQFAMLYQFGTDMAIRMVGLLGLCWIVDSQFPTLIDYGFVVFILVFNLVGLAVGIAVLVNSVSLEMEKA